MVFHSNAAVRLDFYFSEINLFSHTVFIQPLPDFAGLFRCKQFFILRTTIFQEEEVSNEHEQPKFVLNLLKQQRSRREMRLLKSAQL